MDYSKELVIKPVKLSTKKMVIATQIKRFNAVKTARAASLSALKCLSFSLTARSYETAPTFIMLVEFRDYLSQLFGLKVDVVTKNGLKPRIRERVLAEANSI